MGLVSLIASLAIAVPATARLSLNASHASPVTRHDVAFIARHVNGVLAKKCRATYTTTATYQVWIKRHLAAHKARRGVCAPATPWYISKQIWAANILGRESSGDPWPNCPDPYDGGGSWYDTVACENTGNWLDSPGYYRCGLQFDPGWERRFGRLCP